MDTRTAPLFCISKTLSQPNLIPTSSPAFSTPTHPIRVCKYTGASKPSVLPIILPPATLRPLAFRTITKKHNLTLTSSALQAFATFIGKQCGSAWREESLAEKVLDESAKIWKKKGGGLIITGEGEELKAILHHIEDSANTGLLFKRNGINRHESFAFGDHNANNISANPEEHRIALDRRGNLGLSALNVDDIKDRIGNEAKDPRQWLKIVNAFDQPKLIYNINQKHFEDYYGTSHSKSQLL